MNIKNLLKVELFDRLQNYALAQVAEFTLAAYVEPWNAFAVWFGSLGRPRRPPLAYNITIAMCLQSRMDKANSFQ
jgi:hypothetical protein